VGLASLFVKMATEPPPLFDDSDNEETAADSYEDTANLIDVDLTKEESPAPAVPTEDPLFQPPPAEEKEVEKKPEEHQPIAEPLSAPDLEEVKPKPQPDSLFDDDSDTEVRSKEEKKETPVTHDTQSSKPTTLASASDVDSEDKKRAAPAEEEVHINRKTKILLYLFPVGRRGREL